MTLLCLIAVIAVACLAIGARLGYSAGTRQPAPPCPDCQREAEIDHLWQLYDAPAYGDDPC